MGKKAVHLFGDRQPGSRGMLCESVLYRKGFVRMFGAFLYTYCSGDRIAAISCTVKRVIARGICHFGTK